MVKRTLTGSLSQLSPPALLRLLSATSPSGVLELVTDAGALRLEVGHGRIRVPSEDELHHAERVLGSRDGRFRFEPCELREPDGSTIGLGELLSGQAVVAGSVEPGEAAAAPAEIHVLSPAAAGNPLEEMLADLEQTAPDELLLAQVGVVATDPRLWRGALEVAWRRRGWNVVLSGDPRTVDPAGLDLLLLHHRLSVTRVGSEEDWLDLVRRSAAAGTAVPVVWVGPLADSAWVYRLLEAGVHAILPPPASDHGDSVLRFAAALERVVARELRIGGASTDAGLSGGLADLVDAMLRDADTDQAAGVLLQLAAERVTRGAVLLVEEAAIRCRAGFGFPLERGSLVLPRGLALLERVIRARRAVLGVEPDSAAAVQLARAVGVGRLPADSAIIPLGSPLGVSGLLVVDREGLPLPDLRELELVGGRLGGVVVRPQTGADGVAAG